MRRTNFFGLGLIRDPIIGVRDRGLPETQPSPKIECVAVLSAQFGRNVVVFLPISAHSLALVHGRRLSLRLFQAGSALVWPDAAGGQRS